MLVQFNIKETFKNPFISINADQNTPQLKQLAVSIENLTNHSHIKGYVNGRQTIIPLYAVIGFHTEGKSVVCQTIEESYKIKNRIYELNRFLPDDAFIQISSSEILNISSIKRLSLTKNGIYQIDLITGNSTYTSRRFMKKLRRELLQ